MISQPLLLSLLTLWDHLPTAIATPLSPQIIHLPSSLSPTSSTTLTTHTNTTTIFQPHWPIPIIEPISDSRPKEYLRITSQPQPLTADPSFTAQVLRDMITILDLDLDPDQRRGKIRDFYGSNGVVVLSLRMLDAYYLDALAAYEMFARLARLEHAYGAANVAGEIWDGQRKAGDVNVYLQLKGAAAGK